MSLFIELPKGRPVILCGDAADLRENLIDEVAPGFCWKEDETLALASIRKLNAIARAENADLWPNHDFTAYREWVMFPHWRD
jgi:N-acyl homoserine lactone hydrolase